VRSLDLGRLVAHVHDLLHLEPLAVEAQLEDLVRGLGRDVEVVVARAAGARVPAASARARRGMLSV
jgi:hypothetical protein